MMKRLLVVGPLLAALLVLSAQAGEAKPQPNTVKATASPTLTLAMDWPRVAFVSGQEYYSAKIHVWNVVTGATSLVGHGSATRYTSDIAIAGRRLAWIRTRQFGNTELRHWLYTAPIGGSPHLLRRMLGYTETDCGTGGPQMGGLVGSGNTLALSTWTGNYEGSAVWNRRLNLITPTQVRTIATGPDAIVSESADHGRIAVLPLPTTQGVTGDGDCVQTQSTSVAIRSANGTLLTTVALGPGAANRFVIEVALSGRQLVVLTSGRVATLAVYDWRTGELLHTWPLVIGVDHLAVYGQLAAVDARSGLHLIDLATGKDVTIAPAGRGDSPAAIGPRGLVYAVNRHNTGKLVFVPMARLLALLH